MITSIHYSNLKHHGSYLAVAHERAVIEALRPNHVPHQREIRWFINPRYKLDELWWEIMVRFVYGELFFSTGARL